MTKHEIKMSKMKPIFFILETQDYWNYDADLWKYLNLILLNCVCFKLFSFKFQNTYTLQQI